MHRFVLQGMAANREFFSDTNLCYYPYVEPEKGAGSGLLEALIEDASVMVTDDFPCFFLPQMVRKVAKRLPVLAEAVDSNGLLPMRAASKTYPTAYAFRRFLQKELPNHFDSMPKANPLSRKDLPAAKPIAKAIRTRWPQASDSLLEASSESLAELPIDHEVGPATFVGGHTAASKQLRQFMKNRFDRYAEDRNVPDERVTSELSPYLHFGHISAHEVFRTVANKEAWSAEKVEGKKTNGKREGWWGMSETAEGFMDELITWRELGYNMCWQEKNYDKYKSLPDWARKTLEDHADDVRDPCYSLAEFESCSTHDDLWNAAQNQLATEGRMHNYMRMVWGKKILEWSKSPQEALRIMTHLNNKYAVDGRNPNSYSGILWCLGRYDRAWGPERPIFGKIRYMSSDNTKRKFSVKGYLEKYGLNSQPTLFD